MNYDEQIAQLQRIYETLMKSKRPQAWRAFKVLEQIIRLEARKERSERAKQRLAAKGKT